MKNLHLLIIRYFDGGAHEGTDTYIIKCKEDPNEIEPEILYKFVCNDPNDYYDPENCEIEIQSYEPILNLTSRRKEKIVKEIIAEAAEGVIEILEAPDEEHDKIREWVFSQNISIEDFRSYYWLTGEYEKHKVNTIPREDLPLLIDNLKTMTGQDALTERLKL